MIPPVCPSFLPLRIFLADDHEMVRAGFRMILEKQLVWKVVGEAGNGSQSVEKARELKPNVAILDIAMPEMNGLEAAGLIRQSLPLTEVLILTCDDSEEILSEVLKAGIRGYLLKTDADRDLVSAVDALSRHGSFFSSNASRIVWEHYLNKKKSRPRNDQPLGILTPREREVIQLVAEGRSNKEVARRLQISAKTVETHRSNIMHKLDLHSLSDLIRYAIRNKMVAA